MTQRSLSVLIVLNAVLLAAIALTFGPVDQAQAQLGGGSYLMLSGNIAGKSEQVIYIMDTQRGNVAAFTVNSGTKDYKPVGIRSVANDLKGGGGQR